jgi:Tat-targeted selenate reductase subunit YnfE
LSNWRVNWPNQTRLYLPLGPQRQANGELTSRAIAMLPILTGNVGINGGNSGARESTYTITIERMPMPENPVKTKISCFTWTMPLRAGGDDRPA